MGFILLLGLNCVGTFVFLNTSVWNYPGGHAFWKLHQQTQEKAFVHIDVASAMTGVSRFWELKENWVYSKEENLTNFDQFDFLLSETPQNHSQQFEVIWEENGFDKLNLKKFPSIFEISPKIYVLKKKDKKIF